MTLFTWILKLGMGDELAMESESGRPVRLRLVGLLERMTGNPVVSLNRAVAVAMVHGPAEGLALIDDLDDRLPGHYRLDAVRAHLHEMAGDVPRAVAHYRAAAARTTSVPEQRYLVDRAARLAPPVPSAGGGAP